MELKTKLIMAGVVLLSIIFIGSIATAVIERNKAIELQSEIDRRDNEEKIDEPYKDALAKSKRKIEKLEADLTQKSKEAEALMASISERDKTIKQLDSDYRKLVKARPDVDKITKRYKNADIEDICAEFTAIGIPCEPAG